MRKSHSPIVTGLIIIATVATIISVLKVFFDDTWVFFFFSGVTIGIVAAIIASEAIERLSHPSSGEFR